MSKWKGIVGRSFSIEEFKEYVNNLEWNDWVPDFVTIHHTEDPSLKSRPNGLTINHIKGLESYYKGKGWSAGPHLFVDDRQIWVFTPLTTPGVHAKSFNSDSIGLEMLGNYDVEDFNSDRGLEVQKNAVAATAILCKRLEMDPGNIMGHRDEPSTTKTCPGNNVDLDEFVDKVDEYIANEN